MKARHNEVKRPCSPEHLQSLKGMDYGRSGAEDDADMDAE